MAHYKSLGSIRKYGLLSTSALLDLFEVTGESRRMIESTMRRESVSLKHPKHGVAVVRDQKPIGNDKRLEASLGGGATASQFHRFLNGRVFFWVNPDRLTTLRTARAYRTEPQLVLTLDSRKVVAKCKEGILVCPMNSGACMPIAHPRSIGMFQKIEDYDFETWKAKKGGAKKAVVEFTVARGVPDIDDLLIESEIVGA